MRTDTTIQDVFNRFLPEYAEVSNFSERQYLAVKCITSCRTAEMGAHVLVSNSDPRNVNPNDNFFEDLYAPLTIERVRATRMINSNGSGRGEISELLIHN